MDEENVAENEEQVLVCLEVPNAGSGIKLEPAEIAAVDVKAFTSSSFLKQKGRKKENKEKRRVMNIIDNHFQVVGEVAEEHHQTPQGGGVAQEGRHFSEHETRELVPEFASTVTTSQLFESAHPVSILKQSSNFGAGGGNVPKLESIASRTSHTMGVNYASTGNSSHHKRLGSNTTRYNESKHS